jgi:hypothetical protein
VRGLLLATTLMAAGLVACTPSALCATTSGWTNKSQVNLAVCTAPGNKVSPVMVADGFGGAVVAWMDRRGDDWDIYAQHLLANGSVDPAWPVNGRAICAARKDQGNPQIQTDGAGGAIIVWQDDRGDDWDVYAQHVLAGGAVDLAWPADGRAVRAAAGDQRRPAIVTDGIGGAIVAWHDSGHGIQAQRVLANGTLDSTWPSAGRVLCSSDSTQMTFDMVAGRDSGAIVVWGDGRDILAQRVMSNGATDPLWPDGGRLLSTASGVRQSPVIVEDGAGGAVVAWNEVRGDLEGIVFVQHLEADGVVDPTWPADGCRVSATKVLSVAPGEGWGSIPRPPLIADGAGGVILVCSGDSDGVLHVLSSGVLDPAWPEQGCHLSDYFGDHGYQLVTDGSGGAIVTWSKELDGLHFGWSGRYLSHEGNTIAQHVLSRGVVDPSWPKSGRNVSTARGRQFNPIAVVDGAGGAIIVWEDWRGGVVVGKTIVGDLYAQRVGPNGKLGGTVVMR